MTAALEGGEWSAARPGRTLPLGKTQYPLYRRVGGPQGRSGRAEILVPIGIRSRTVQPVVSRYTDWATGPTQMSVYNIMNYISITRCVIFLMPAMYEGGRCRQNTTVFVSLLLGWRNVSATVGHLRVTKMYNEEKLYSVISLVAVHIVNLQRDLDAMRFIRIELITCSTLSLSVCYRHCLRLKSWSITVVLLQCGKYFHSAGFPKL